MVTVGVIGVGTLWEIRYLPALKKLAKRIRISAVYDAVADRAQQVASELQAVPMIGARALCHRKDVQAILLLDANWQRDTLLHLIYPSQKPVYIACRLGDDLDSLQSFHKAAIEDGVTLMPELGLRYTPATSRLKELIVTRLGLPVHITIDATETFAPDCNHRFGTETTLGFLVGWLDWCKYVASAAPIRIDSRALEVQAPQSGSGVNAIGRSIRIEFERAPDVKGHSKSRSRETKILAQMRVPHLAPEASNLTLEGALLPIGLEVRCERGTALIKSPTSIGWQTDAQLITESLAEERSEVEVMLDHFCRRVVGGLIPVADVNDVCRSLALVRAAEESFRSGRPVALAR